MRILNIHHLYNLIMTCVDMRIDNMFVISQTTRGPIIFDERVLKYNPNGFTLVHKGEVQFDPLNNYKQTRILFSIFLQFQEEDEGLYTQMFYDEKDPQDELRTRAFMRTNNGNFASQYYYNISLGYIELILALSGVLVENLYEFDSAPPVEDEKKPRKKTIFPVRDLF